MKKHPDGSIITQFFDVTSEPQSGKDIYDQGLKIVVGQVEKIYYVDDQYNVSKKFVEYDVSVRDAQGGQSVLRNLRFQNLLGGANDYDEIILEANEYASKGKLEVSNLFINKNGSTVIVASLDGSKDRPMIIGCLQHPKIDGAERSDGIRRKGEFRGLQWEINKDGEFTLTQQGARSADGKLKFTGALPSVISMLKDGSVTISTKSGAKLTLNSSEVKIEHGSTVINLDSSGKISLTGSLVDIGEGASALAVLGPQLVSWLNSHTHMSPGGLTPAPTSAPLSPPPSDMLSTSVKLKS